MKKIYLSAPISVFVKQNKDWKEYFIQKEAEYESEFIVFSPRIIGYTLELKHIVEGKNPPTQAEYMTECAKMLFENFYENPKDNYMSMHPDWKISTGCRCELGIAQGLKINIIYEK